MLFYQLCFCLVVGLISVSQKSNAATCDYEIIERIQSLWEKSGTPKNILQKNLKDSPDYVVYTTKDYLKDVSDETDVVCSLTYWEKNPKGAEYQPITLWKNYTSSYGNLKTVVEQRDGETYIPDDNRLSYHIPTGDKVSAFYTCADDDEGLNATLELPEGVVKVNKGYSKEALENALRQLEWALDRKLESKFPDTCGSITF